MYNFDKAEYYLREMMDKKYSATKPQTQLT
jgi:pentatricopeptide repeat protein